MPSILLQSCDGKIFEADLKVAQRSGILKTMLGACGMEKDENPVVPLANVRAAILQKVLILADYHKDDPEFSEDNKDKDPCNYKISSWDAEFLGTDQSTLCEIILAANYLDVGDLLDVACKQAADMIKGKTPKEIRHTFSIKKDFTTAEEEQVLKQSEWCDTE